MGSLTLILLIVTVLYLICIGITPKSTAAPPSSWECDTCGAGNQSDAQKCRECGMERPA